MSDEPTFDPEKGAALLRDAEAWSARKKAEETTTFEELRAALVATVQTFPEKVEIPFHLTPEGERWANFKKVCDARFMPKVDYSLVKFRQPFDRVLHWDGRSPGLLPHGETGAGKTFACWAALRRLYVTENRAFAWFPAKRLCTEMEKYDAKNIMDEFYRFYDFFPILFVDDLEKINWQFQSNSEMLFAFFDWIYRRKKPCLVTTNCGRAWWSEKMGDAFTRRLFDEACTEVEFK